MLCRNLIHPRLRHFQNLRSFSTAATDPAVNTYFKTSMSIGAFKQTFSQVASLSEAAPVQVAGRVIGKRKASSTLIFLDLESNGDRV